MKKAVCFILCFVFIITACSVGAFSAELEEGYTRNESNGAWICENPNGKIINIGGIGFSGGQLSETTTVCVTAPAGYNQWKSFVLLEKVEGDTYTVISQQATYWNPESPTVPEENQLLLFSHSSISMPEDEAREYYKGQEGSDSYKICFGTDDVWRCTNWKSNVNFAALTYGDKVTFKNVDLTAASGTEFENATATIERSDEPVDKYPWAEKHIFESDAATLPYRLVLPEGYDESKSYPLIVFFHGAGERGNDNQLQLFHCVKYIADNAGDAIVVAPQCPEGNQWVDTPWANGAYSVDAVPESNEMKAAILLIQQLCEDYAVDSDRIYATGISMGGFGTWDAIMRHGDLFAAAVPVCGGGDPTKAEALKDIPIFTFHGTADPTVPFSGTEVTVNAIKEAGGEKIEFVAYEGAGHGIWNDAFATEGLLDKMLACKLSDRIEKEESPEPSEQVSEDMSDESEDDKESEPFSPVYLIPIIAAVVIAAALIIMLVLKKK